jgi:uncharacterized sporulation protein YeaH/YhbH (DUF444 family)
MSEIIDRRLNSRRKSAVNQQRFLRRYRAQVREAVARAVTGRKIAEQDRDASVSIPSRDLNEPVFSHGRGGKRTGVLPGNREFVPGDEIQRPQGGQGRGSGQGQASNEGEGEDEFRFRLSREEFLEFFFEDMELPDLVKTQLAALTQQKRVRGGYRVDGTPSNLAIIRTMRGSLARRIALAGPYRAQLRDIEEEMQVLEEANQKDTPRYAELLAEHELLRHRIARVPFIDDFDLRYNNRITQPRPIAQAVMFCIMDVSGSMDENRKDLAKRFFILLHLFLTKHYERIDIVFIRHHTSAKVVDEDEFFHSQESGGTIVSSALELALEHMKEHYPSDQWNIYVAQASDGDNWDSDSPRCRELLVNDILPRVQYYSYVEIEAEQPQSLWLQYEEAKAACRNLALTRVRTRADVYPALRELFARKNAQAQAAA